MSLALYIIIFIIIVWPLEDVILNYWFEKIDHMIHKIREKRIYKKLFK